MQINKNDIIIEKDIIKHWQSFLDAIAKKLGVPVALIMKIDIPNIKVLLANKSAANPYEVGESCHLLDSGLYCEEVYKTKKELLIPNALNDKKWDKNPDIKLNMISYLGFPLLWPDGEVFGTTCVLDVKENEYSVKYKNILMQFKKYVEAYLDLAIAKHLRKSKEEIAEKDLLCDSMFLAVENMVRGK